MLSPVKVLLLSWHLRQFFFSFSSSSVLASPIGRVCDQDSLEQLLLSSVVLFASGLLGWQDVANCSSSLNAKESLHAIVTCVIENRGLFCCNNAQLKLFNEH